jgi:HD-GYP domain-containing protein (c-di-GMP phosphodiesterase class II)
METEERTGPETRLAELIAALSLATDLGMGQPMEFALRVATLAVELGQRLGLTTDDLADVYYLALVKHIGCTSDSLEFAAFSGGDDIAFRRRSMLFPAAPPAHVIGQLLRHTGEERPPVERARLVAGMVAAGRKRPRQTAAAHCEAGGRLCERLGLSEGVRIGLSQEQERWDGKGLPDGIAGDALSHAHRVVMVAHDAIGIAEAHGDVVGAVRAGSGRAYDPDVAAAFPGAWQAFAGAGPADALARALAIEPGRPVTVGEVDVDRVALAFADFTDLKSPYMFGHSTRVAALAEAGARVSGLHEREQVTARRAALLHDVGRTGVPNGIWDKPGPLSASEHERVRLHAYYTERVLARSPVLARLAVSAGSHHENLDGSGYHRRLGAAQLDPVARLLRAADCLDAMLSERPHRPALKSLQARDALKAEVAAGRLDGEAAAAVIEASGGERARLRTPRRGGLSEREVEVLVLMVRGLTNRQIAARLYISPKTVGHHVEHIYAKLDITSRAAAALFAMESGLV